MSNQLDAIISDIEEENCVLVLGPDIIDFGDKSFFEAMCLQLLEDSEHKNIFAGAPQYVFLNEELLELQDSAASESSIIRGMKKFYKAQTSFDEPLKKISQIPFHLIISMLPDERLQKIFEAQGIEINYSYYPKEETPAPVEKPTRKKPLLYNLLGDLKQTDVVFTFDHLFHFLLGIMGKRELPHNIQEQLKKANTFLFLGVHFERWYVQLLLKIITSTGKKDRFTILQDKSNNGVCTFVARRLKLSFLAKEPLDFLNELHTACKNKKVLRTTPPKVFISYSHTDKSVAYTIQNGLKNNKIEVIMDDFSMPAGQKIEDFINVIADVDIVIPIVSLNSLLSPWVSKEIMITITKTNKHLLACNLDDTLQDKGFTQKAETKVDEEIQQINNKITLRGRANTDDLFTERKYWSEYYSNLSRIIDELKRRKYISFKAENIESTIDVLVKNIYNIMQD